MLRVVGTSTCAKCIRLSQRIEQLTTERAQLRKRIAALEAENAALREQASENSHNSSKPPSSDPTSGPRHSERAGTGRHAGGQTGHRGTSRTLVDKPDRIHEVDLHRCEKCGSRRVERTVTAPRRHQVAEIATAAGTVFEWRSYEGQCQDCAHRGWAHLPDGVPAGGFGPKLQATIAYMTGTLHLPRRVAAQAIQDLFGVPMSLGSVSATEAVVSEVIKAPVQEAHRAACAQPVAHIDETGWRHHHGKAWLWVLGTGVATIFKVAHDRGYSAFHSLTRRFDGILISDRWVIYDEWELSKRQLCWSHLERTWNKFVERGGPSAQIGRALLAETRQMFHWWHKVRDGTMTREHFRRHMGPVITRVYALLGRGMKMRSNHATRGTCARIRRLGPALWTFIEVEGVQPTNNSGEQRLRTAVQWRKISLGTQSAAGHEYVERMLSATVTLRQHGSNVYEYLVEAMNNHLRGLPASSLLRPHHRTLNQAA